MLTSEQDRQKLENYGFNELVEGIKQSTLWIFSEQFRYYHALLLIIESIVYGLIDD